MQTTSPVRLGIPVTGKYDGATLEVVAAFQRHLRPARVDGVADHSTMATLRWLAGEFLPGRCGDIRGGDMSSAAAASPSPLLCGGERCESLALGGPG